VSFLLSFFFENFQNSHLFNLFKSPSEVTWGENWRVRAKQITRIETKPPVIPARPHHRSGVSGDLTDLNAVCNLECAILLSKWLMTLASISPGEPPASPEEKSLLDMVRRMLDETEFAVPIDPSLGGGAAAAQRHGGPGGDGSDAARLRQLAAAVIRLWAETFKGTHIFELVRIMAIGLEGYAEMLEKPGDRTPIVRLGAVG
jgi:hypothetical protein